MTSANINNLNILTFIKDIYLSLKHIDICINNQKDNIDARLVRIEDNNQTILNKLNSIEELLYKLNSNTQQQVTLDKHIEHELMEKMNDLNKHTSPDKLILNTDELTFANIIENNYTILDINNSLKNNQLQEITDVKNIMVVTDNIKQNDETLEKLLF